MKTKNNIVVLLIAFFLTFSIPNMGGRKKINSVASGEIRLSNSNIEVNPFTISGNLGWENLAATQTWCSGSGTWSDPYIIKNIIIDSGNSGSGIYILNSDVSFIIKNSSFYNSGRGGTDAGIKLKDVSNGKLIKNIISFNLFGVYSSGNSNKNNTIEDNYLYYNWHGLAFFKSNEENIIRNNTILGNPYSTYSREGIRLIKTSRLIIIGNVIKDYIYGVYFSASDKYNILQNNSMINCGIFFSYHNLPVPSLVSNIIDKSNLVNHRPLYYYYDQSDLQSDNFTNAGQVVLAFCDNSVVSSLNLSYTSTGLSLFYCNKITILNNILNNNKVMGLNIRYSHNTTISNNIANDNDNSGIHLDASNYNTIDGNQLNDNMRGLFLRDSHNNLIYNNIANHNYRTTGQVMQNSGSGYILWRSNYNTLEGNIALDNPNNGAFIGVYEWKNERCSFNLINDNDFSFNGLWGIYLKGDHNNLTYNHFSNNDGGVKLISDSQSNLLAYNSFISNDINAEDNGLTNGWDDGSIGNYWSDYTGVDADGDGFGDTPYFILGTAGSADNFPVGEFGLIQVYSVPIYRNSGWASLAASQTWCSGSGTQADPYIIEGINTTSIRIYSSNVFFIVRDCLIEGNKVMLQYAKNGVFENNIIRNTRGFRVFYGNNIIIRGNIIENNINPNKKYEEQLHILCENVLVYNNTFIVDSVVSWGIPLRWSTGQAKDHYYDNTFWDNGAIGNYWSDYLGADMDGDGIGDIFYLVTSQYGNRDNYPICNRNYISPPEEWMDFITRFLRTYFIATYQDHPQNYIISAVLKPLDCLTHAGTKFENGQYFDAFDKIRDSLEFLILIPDLYLGSHPHDQAIQNVIDYLIYLVKFIVDDAMKNALDIVGEDDKFIIKALEHHETALLMLELEDYGEAVRFFKHSYRNILKAKGELIIESFIDDLFDNVEKIQELQTGEIPNEAINYLTQAENKILLAIEKANNSMLSQSIIQLKEVVKDLLDVEDFGINTADIIESILQNAEDITYLKIVEAEFILMGASNMHIDKAWINYNKAINHWNSGKYGFALSYYAKAIEKVKDALS